MSFSIPTLRAYRININGNTLLDSPIINWLGSCGNCSNIISGTITSPVGTTVKVKVGGFSSTLAVTCSDYTYSTTGNVAYFNNSAGPGSDSFPCLSRYNNGLHIRAITCSGATASDPSDSYHTAVSCPVSVTAPTITKVSSTSTTTTFNVTSYDCGTTYITYQKSIFCGQGTSTPSSSNYDFSFVGSGVSSNYTVSNQQCTAGNFGVSATTYFDISSCSTVQSSVTFSNI